MNGYGTQYFNVDMNDTTSKTHTIISNDQRWDLDTLHVKIENLDAGGSLTIGYGANANSPEIHTFKSICDTDVRIRNAGVDNQNQNVLNAVWSAGTGTGALLGSINAGAHIVKQDIPKYLNTTNAPGFAGTEMGVAKAIGSTIYFMGGQTGTGIVNKSVWSSPDGITWTQLADAGFSARRGMKAVIFNSKIYVIGGYDGGTYFDDVYSFDGTTWTTISVSGGFGGRENFGLAQINGLLYVIGGTNGADLGDVWSSPDGVTWTLINAAAAFSARYSMGCLEFQNRIWITGGVHGGTDQNDTWYSADGITWIQATNIAAYTARHGMGFRTFNNNKQPIMIVFGGVGVSSYSDQWISTDGRIWTALPAPTPDWSARSYFANCIFNNSIYVIGGLDGSSNYLNDVWRTNVPIV